MYRLATTAARTHSEKPNRRNFRAWNNRGQRGHVNMAILHATFLVCRADYDWPS